LIQQPSRRSVLITGCSSGIGYTAATTLKARGFDVYATTRKPQDTAALSALGINALHLDLDNEQSIEQALSEVLEQTQGKLYALFNNGGYGQGGAVMPYRGAYNAAKFAIEGLTDTLRLELRDTDIHVSIIQPGPVRTLFRQNGLAKFEQHIDHNNSVHRDVYSSTLQRLSASGDASRFTVAPEVVVNKLVHALEHPKPHSRYRVTKPTIIFAVAKRLLPVSMLDRLLF